ncbi:MAG: hypothetical protein COS34_12355 [Lysobacterales bacterium CG02_land_8_20_14_3_00_62_12]|nr:MAG: hypothetical protein COS34_12355 [Xanthomonadales bacterium CG02_land_8_20_14_3_00_62_12]
MIELLIALFIKFWMFLFGILRGTVSAIPIWRRLLLRNQIECSQHGGRLVIRASCDLLLQGLRVLAVRDTEIEPVGPAELILRAGQSEIVELPVGTLRCVLIAELVDLHSGRRSHWHRRVAPAPLDSAASS